MSEYPGFGVLLAELSSRRGLDFRRLPGLAKVTEQELQPVFDGAKPSSMLLTRLAPALGFHAADLFVIAEAPVPEELLPLDSEAGWEVPKVAGQAMRLSPESLGQLLEFARSLPQHARKQPASAPKSYEQYPPGFGAVLLRMLANRNLNWISSASVLACLTGGHQYLSAATVGAVGRDRKEVTPGLLVGFAAVLGIPAGDLAILGGIELPGENLPAYPVPDEMAALIWELRRLTVGQVRQVINQANSMLL